MDRTLLWMRVVALGLLALAVAGLGEGPVVAQQPGRVQNQIRAEGAAKPNAAADDPPEQALDGVLLPSNRDLRVTMRRAEKGLEDNRTTDAVQLLNSILRGPEDYFFQPDPKQPVYRSMKAEAQRLIGAMSPEGRQAYELQFGAEAKRDLQAAIASGNPAGIENVSRQFLHTEAGNDATLLLARHHLDHGRPLAAALCLERLQNSSGAAERFEPTLSILLAAAWQGAGQSDKAQLALLHVKDNFPNARLQIGKMPTPLFRDKDQAVAWLQATVGDQPQGGSGTLDQWALFRGNAARNAASAGGRPILRPRWRVPTSTQPDVEQALLKVQKRYLDANLTVLPGAHPLAVRDTVLMRTSSNLLAVDFVTGKRIWGIPSNGEASDSGVGNFTENNLLMRGRGFRNRRWQEWKPDLNERSWDNATFGTLSSDGECVYSVEELPFVADPSASSKAVVLNNGVRRVLNRGPEIFNKLAARELKTEGKLRWEVGGATGGYEPQLAGAFFLGPPLPLQDRLYVLAEVKGEIRLVVLQQTKDPLKPVRVEWSQQLAQVEQTISVDSLRRTAGATPSFADGVLVCPTAAGVVVGVDLTTRSLLWGYKYERAPQTLPTNGFFGNVNLRGGAGIVVQMGAAIALDSLGSGSGERWNDGCATIVSGKVLVTPVESDKLHCINLVDGSVLWKLDRNENLYVGCVHKDNVIVIGRHEVQAYHLSDGKPAWKKPIELSENGMPSGRGYYSNDCYYLPLTTASVAKIDLNEGAIKDAVPSWRGNIPGNLICYKGQVISLGIEFLEAFYQIEPLEQRVAANLATNPNEPEALARRGEMQLMDGKLAGALTDLRRSYALEPRADTRDLLVETLLASLRDDFAVNRESLAELEKLIELPSERSAYLRLLAIESRRSGEARSAIEAYLKLADLEPAETAWEPSGAKSTVRRDRWIDSQLSQLVATMSPEDRAVLQAAVTARLKTAVGSTKDQVTELRNFLSCFGSQPGSDQAREMLAAKLSTRESMLEKELLLHRLEQSSDAARSRAAVARLAMLLLDSSRWDDALVYYRRLAGEYADLPCLGGKTGRQLVADLPPASPVRRGLEQSATWPNGEVEVAPAGSPPSMPRQPNNKQVFSLPLRGAAGPFFDNSTVNCSRERLTVRGPLGKERFQINLLDRTAADAGFRDASLMQGNFAVAQGHLLIAVVGTQVIAMDTLRSDLGGEGVLWRKDLIEQVPNVQFVREAAPPKQVNSPWGLSRYLPTEAGGQSIGSLGPVTDSAICLQSARDVYGLHPLSGETVWVQHALPPGSELFGDDEFVFVAGPDAAEASVLRLLDGELVGKRPVPPTIKRLAMFGRRVLTWNENGDKLQLILRDPWEQKDVWSFEFGRGSKADIVDDAVLGVMEPSGHFVLISVDDGKKLIDEQLEPQRLLKGILLLRSRDQYHLVVDQPPTAQGEAIKLKLQPVPEAYFAPHQEVSGRIYAFDRQTGKKQWPTPAEVSTQYLITQAPSDLPVIPFVRLVMSDGQQSGYRGSILCLDKRTGRVVFQRNEDLQVNGGLLFDIAANLENRTVSVLYSANQFTLRYTDNPRPPEPPPQALTNAGGDRPQAHGSARFGQKLLQALGEGVKAAEVGVPVLPQNIPPQPNNPQPNAPAPAK